MQYYVIGPDGSKYGPADIPTLKQWAAENRLNPDAMLEDFNTGQRVTAAQVQGIFEADAPGAPVPTAATTTDTQRGQMAQQLPSGSSGPSLYDSPVGNMAPGYYTRGNNSSESGSKELTSSYISTVVGLLCCPIIGPALGIFYANKSLAKGNLSGQGAKIFGIVILCLNCVGVTITILRLITTGKPF